MGLYFCSFIISHRMRQVSVELVPRKSIKISKIPASSSSSKSSSSGTSDVWLEISSKTDIEDDKFFASIGLCGFCGVFVGEFSFSSSAAGGT